MQQVFHPPARIGGTSIILAPPMPGGLLDAPSIRESPGDCVCL